MRDHMNSLHFVKAIAPAAATTDNTAWVSDIVDTAGYEGCTLLLQCGSLADADATFAVTLEHGNDAALADTAAPAATDLVGTPTLAGFQFDSDNKCRKIGYIGSKRYVRATVTPSNNTGNAFLSGTWVLGRPHVAPTPNPPS